MALARALNGYQDVEFVTQLPWVVVLYQFFVPECHQLASGHFVWKT